MSIIQHIAYSIWLGLWCALVAFFATVVAWHWWKSRQPAEDYHGRHRHDEERSPYVDWAAEFAGRVMHWIAVNAQPVMDVPTQVLPVVDLEETQALFLPDEDDTPRDLTHYQLSGGDANYLRLKDAMLEAELELIRAELVPQPVKLRPPFQIEDIYDEAWELVSAEATR